MSRFSKKALVEQLRAMEDLARAHQGRVFDNSNGTAQLRPRGVKDDETEKLIDRAVRYGEWRTLQKIASDLENGLIGGSNGTA